MKNFVQQGMNGQLKEHGAKALDVQLREEEMQQLQEGEMEIGQFLDVGQRWRKGLRQ